jgi:hypothetical protein
MLALISALILSLGAAHAHAAPKGVVDEFGSQGSGDGRFETPRGLAVNTATGDVYVVDDANHRVQRFSSGGEFELAFGSLGRTAGSAAGQFDNPQGIAIDQDTGHVFVTDRDNRRVQKFDADGNFLLMWGWDVVANPPENPSTTFEVCATPASCKTGVAGAGDGQFGATTAPLGLAVSVPDGNPLTGSVFVADPGNRRVQEFSLGGAFLSKFGTAGTGDGQFGTNQPLHVAVDSAGIVYASDSNSNNRVQRFNTNGDPDNAPLASIAGQPTAGAPLTSGTTLGLAVDPDSDGLGSDTDRLLVTRDPSVGDTVVQELDSPAGTPAVVDTHADGEGFTTLNGIGLNSATGLIYLSSTIGGHRVFVLDVGTQPAVTIDPVTNPEPDSATFKGTVNPNGALTRWRFEYKRASDPDIPANWTRVPADDAVAGTGTTAVNIIQPTVEPLRPGTQYQLKLVADGWGAPVTAPAPPATQTFTTPLAGPAVPSSGATAGATTATLRGRIHPRGKPATYRFEYGLTTAYGSVVPDPDGCVVLFPEGCVDPADDDPDDTDRDGVLDRNELDTLQSVAESISGLEPNTTYHFRLVATNADGTTEGPDRTFTTGPAEPEPPAGRAYEKVSPDDKNGNDARSAPGAWASESGDGVVWNSGGSFAGQPSAPISGYYQSLRQQTFWATTGISLPVEPGPFVGATVAFLISDDVSKSVSRSQAVLVPGAALDMDKLYLHDHATHTYRLITPAPRSSTTTQNVFAIDGTPDLRHVLFETPAALTADAVTGLTGTNVQLYHWIDDGTADGALRLASVLPDGTPAAGTAGAADATSQESIDNSISDDGSVIFFSSPPSFIAGRPYRREGGVTVPLNEEENPNLVLNCETAACTATFRGASPDGSKAIFTSGQRLVAGDTNNGSDLYLYNHDAPADSNLTLLSLDREPDAPAGADVQGVVAASDDLSRIYFVAANQIVPGESSTAPRKLYLWDEDDGVRYLGGLSNTFADQRLWVSGGLGTRQLSSVTADGRRLLLITPSQLTAPQDNGGLAQAYLYDAEAAEFACVSCPAAGLPSAEATLTGLPGLFTGELFNPRGRRHLSADGTRAFFQTGTPLLPEDVNGDQDVYMWEDGAPHLISTGKGDGAAFFVDASSSGDNVFFSTPEQLVSWDTDTLYDVYDARVGGGLPERPQGRPPCAGDECQGDPSSPPRFDDPGSSQHGSGDAAPGPRPGFTLARLSRAARARLARTGRTTVPVRVNRAGRVSLTAKSKMGQRSRIVARSSKTASRAGTVRLPLRLSKAARRRLARGRPLRLALSVRFAGVREPKTRTLSVRRASARSSGKAG